MRGSEAAETKADPLRQMLAASELGVALATQQDVFEGVGSSILASAAQGYNHCVLAYGQTGSGKSHTMIGSRGDPGLIPRICRQIFEGADGAGDAAPAMASVEMSMLEVYQERVYDLLGDGKGAGATKAGLKVREHPKHGPYVDGLRAHRVRSHADVEALMKRGYLRRTIHATAMNQNSSRAHTIVQIRLAFQSSQSKRTKRSLLNLVDLAGSERAARTGAVGQRAKEGVLINKSLLTLGHCISVLADMADMQAAASAGRPSSASRRRSTVSGSAVHVPYRDSVLTYLLQESLGGNSRTFMLAAVSPAARDYGETVSTLQYAARARSVRTVAVVNEVVETASSSLAAAEEARALVAREVENMKMRVTQAKDRELEEMRSALARSEAALVTAQKQIDELSTMPPGAGAELIESSFHASHGSPGRQSPDQGEAAQLGGAEAWDDAAVREDGASLRLANLHEDAFLDRSLIIRLVEGVTAFGKEVPAAGAPAPAVNVRHVMLRGLGIAARHCIVESSASSMDGEVPVVAMRTLGTATVWVNGRRVGSGDDDAVQLHHGDRVVLGSHHVFVVLDPRRVRAGDDAMDADWQGARRELQQGKGTLSALLGGGTAEDAPPSLGAENSTASLDGALGIDRHSATSRARLLADSYFEEELSRGISACDEANLMGQELERACTLSVRLVGRGAVDGSAVHRPRVIIIATYPGNLELQWNLDSFLNDRFYVMQEIYYAFAEFGDTSDLNTPRDPWLFSKAEPQPIGSVKVRLKPLAYGLDVDFASPILSLSDGSRRGDLVLRIEPLIPGGDDDLDSSFGSSMGTAAALNLLGRRMTIRVEIKEASNIPKELSRNVYCRFSFFDGSLHETVACEGPTRFPYFGFSRDFIVDEVRDSFLGWLSKDVLVVDIFGAAAAHGGDFVNNAPERGRALSTQGEALFARLPGKDSFRERRNTCGSNLLSSSMEGASEAGNGSESGLPARMDSFVSAGSQSFCNPTTPVPKPEVVRLASMRKASGIMKPPRRGSVAAPSAEKHESAISKDGERRLERRGTMPSPATCKAADRLPTPRFSSAPGEDEGVDGAEHLCADAGAPAASAPAAAGAPATILPDTRGSPAPPLAKTQSLPAPQQVGSLPRTTSFGSKDDKLEPAALVAELRRQLTQARMSGTKRADELQSALAEVERERERAEGAEARAHAAEKALEHSSAMQQRQGSAADKIEERRRSLARAVLQKVKAAAGALEGLNVRHRDREMALEAAIARRVDGLEAATAGAMQRLETTAAELERKAGTLERCNESMGATLRRVMTAPLSTSAPPKPIRPPRLPSIKRGFKSAPEHAFASPPDEDASSHSRPKTPRNKIAPAPAPLKDLENANGHGVEQSGVRQTAAATQKGCGCAVM